jgi:paraquat-inducible protein B
MISSKLKARDALTIGAFMVGALVLVVSAVLIWGSGRLFRRTVEFVCYFDSSVNGLAVGAPVKARGVAIGRVVGIQLQYRQQPTDHRVPVFVEMDLERLGQLGLKEIDPLRAMPDLIARGLRARLETESLVTGTLFVDLGFHPNTPIVLAQLQPEIDYAEIPTVPRELAAIGKSVSALLSKLESVDVDRVVGSIDGAAASVNRLASTGKLPEALTEFAATMSSFRRLGRTLDAELPPLLADAQTTMVAARNALERLDGAAGAANRLVAPDAALSHQLSEALSQVAGAADAIRTLADYLKRNPNSLLVGKSR